MPTIAGIATTDPDLSILTDVLVYLDANIAGSALVATLSDPLADLTVFAPTNGAFAILAADLGYGGDPADTTAVTAFLVSAVPASLLNDVVLYHVLPASQEVAELAFFGAVPTLLGPTIGTGDLPTLVDNEPDLIDPTLVASDIPASNGVVHVVDRVLLPVDLPGNDAPTFAALIDSGGFDADPGDFDLLAAFAGVTGLDKVLDDASLDLTVFAPTDQAFLDLATGLGWAGTTEIDAFTYLFDAATLLGGGDPIPVLESILLTHVLGESLQSAEVLGRGAVQSLQGLTLGLDGLGLVDGEPDLPNAQLIGLDIQAANGVAHVIDGVLIPVDLLASDGSDDVDFIIGNDFRDDRIVTGADDDFIFGKGGNDRLFGGAGDDVILGGTGFDRIVAGAGDDLVRGGSEGDLILGQSGNDIIDGQDGDDRLYGHGGSDLILGGTGIDRLFGGGGRDVLNGGADQDIMTGGGGRDTFVFSAHSGADIITDFAIGLDKLDFSELDTSLASLEIKTSGDDTLIFVNATGDFVRLKDVAASHLTADDFIF